MYKTFAHAGHSHGTSETMEHMSTVDYNFTPIIIGAGAVVAIALGVATYLLVSKQSKAAKKTKDKYSK